MKIRVGKDQRCFAPYVHKEVTRPRTQRTVGLYNAFDAAVLAMSSITRKFNRSVRKH